MKFSVLHICNYAAAYKGGFINSLEYLRKDLQKESVGTVYLFPHRALSTNAKNWIEELKRDGATVYIQTDSFIKNILLIRKIVKKHNIKKVFRHFNDLKADAIIKLVCPGVPIVRLFHCEYGATGLSHKLRKLLYKRDIMVGVSDTVTGQVAELFPGNRTETLQNAIYFDRFLKLDPFEKPEKIACLTMGYNVAVKGIDLTFEVFKRIREKYDVLLYVVVASHREELEAEIKRQFGTKPEWLKVLPPTENIGTYYHNSDIFLSPSRTEGLPYALFEAMYCGCLAVASDIPQLITDKVSSVRYFKSEDVNEYEKVLLKAIEAVDLPQTETERKKAKEEIISNYSMQVWCDRFKEYI